MKFFHRHRTDILFVLKKHQLKECDFDFIKKRGRICTRHKSTGQEFAYMRKKETQIDAFTREWKHVSWFRVKSGNGKEQTVEHWEEVMKLFEEWLLGIRNYE
jgi:hypothetical protein